MADQPTKKKPEPKFILDPYKVTPQEISGLRRWAYEIIKKKEYKLNTKWQIGAIVDMGTFRAESLDIGQVYAFPDLQWLIYRDQNRGDKTSWAFLILSKHKILLKINYVKI